MSLNELNKKDPKYIQNDPKWAGKSLNDLKWALMRSNFNKIFTSDACQCKARSILQFFGVINVGNKEKESVFCTPFSSDF